MHSPHNAGVGKAWQRQIRESVAEQEASDGRGEYWKEYDLDITSASVRPVNTRTARSVIEQYEWLGRMAGITSFSFGLYFGDQLGGVVTYSPEYTENLGVWDRYGYTGKIILLSRGACVHWAHPHSASKLIRGSMHLLPARYEVVTATVDANAGEVGTVYQACGFDYIGSMPNSANHDGAIIDGKLYSSRNLTLVFGTRSIRRLQAQFGEERLTVVKEPPKARYFAFRGAKAARRRNRAAIAHLVKPYPRRDAGAQPAQLYEGRAGNVLAA